jgi:hypothetical protein
VERETRNLRSSGWSVGFVLVEFVLVEFVLVEFMLVEFMLEPFVIQEPACLGS